MAALYAQNGMSLKAVELWNEVEGERHEDWEVACNFIGAACMATGQVDAAKALFTRSLTLDSGQYPIELALRELNDPFVVRDVDLSNGRVAICLYSYNKAELLDMTLRSLCVSDIGDSEVVVLLNGCSDGSRGSGQQKCIPIFRPFGWKSSINLSTSAHRPLVILYFIML